ncbi:PhnB protein [Plantibacter sp. VKM Ac-1784]|uniref:PhnB protein n=1 Tax=Plantibacter elymi (nom. nud.) TaxID=199708 RepID=A0ABY1RIV3_9MICO|nr:PhnB protein [Plantibacter sp. VKM Ac-1784]
MTTLNPYLGFRGTAREAMEFYQGVFGGELTVSTFRDFGAEVEPDELDLVMHAQLTGDAGVVFMASDTPKHMDYSMGSDFSMSLSGPNEDEAQLTGYFDNLAAGGTVQQPLTVAPWGDSFGMLQDRFGVAWMVNIAAPAAA